MKTWFSIKAKADPKPGESDAEVMIYDEIGYWGVRAKDFIKALKDSGTKAPLVRINSPGGDVMDGIAIANYLRTLDTTIQIDGIAASMASYIATAGKRVNIADNAFVMIHNPWGVAVGDAEQLREQADVLDKIGQTLANGYSTRTGKSIEAVQAWMNDETWFNAAEAKDAGLVDNVNASVSFSASLTSFRKAPDSLRTSAAASTPVPPNNAQQKTTTTPQKSTTTMKKLLNALALAGFVSSVNLDDDAAAAEFENKFNALTKERDDLKANLDTQAKENATTAVDAAIRDGRITAETRDGWIAAIAKDTGAQALLAKLPAKLPGSAPVGRSVGSDDSTPKTLTEKCLEANKAATGAR